MISGVIFPNIYGNPSFEMPGTLPMVVLAAGGFGVSTDGAGRPDHLRRRAGKRLAKLELGDGESGQHQSGPQRLVFHQCDSEQHSQRLAGPLPGYFGNEYQQLYQPDFLDKRRNGRSSGASSRHFGKHGTNTRSNRAAAANSWQQVTLSMTALGVANQANFTGFWLQAEGSSTIPTFYVDDISLVTNAIVCRHQCAGFHFRQRAGKSTPNQPFDLRRGVRDHRINWQT